MSRASAAAALALAGGFAALGALVAGGVLTSLDQWAVRHAMPAAHFTASKPTLADAVVPFRGAWWHGGVAVATNLLTVPAGAVVATVLMAVACRKVGGRAGVALAAAYVAGAVVEAIVKSALERPALHGDGLHLAGFDHSYPSGHALRAVLLVAGVGAAWPRLRLPAAAWAAAMVVFLELGAWHVPSDLGGGLLLAGALVATAWASCCGLWSRPSSSRASRPCARAR